MINAVEYVSLEDAIDTIAEIILGPEFAEKLRHEHAIARVAISFRYPEWVYTEDKQTPDGYPCCELIATHVADEGSSELAELDHEISVEWSCNGDDEQIMGREVKRLIAATRATFRNGMLLPNIGGKLRTGDVDFGPVLAARATDGAPHNARFIKSASIAIFWKAFAR